MFEGSFMNVILDLLLFGLVFISYIAIVLFRWYCQHDTVIGTQDQRWHVGYWGRYANKSCICGCLAEKSPGNKTIESARLRKGGESL